ncbi:efflux RND transporter permease subunit [Acidiphilium acidophilum]|uniref:Efflux RND transporter permease subunit n=1 Tax=Acidiphilium acidophilum TaxID=76588 RepID=A0AAW9DRW2_ACIAO|nr:efflux RND transporter permease subunit [Acidiphilium acidophilum]MDX5931083.1 efflux RND transporter permease subunit [Acidiphilium acidophilum]
MSFSEPFIRRPIGTALLAIGIMIAGILAYGQLPVAAVPSIPIPAIVVFASEPGASPSIMASTVAAPLEHTLGTIPGIDDVRSINSVGSSSVILLFDTDTNINTDAHAVQAAINAALPNLPSAMPSRPFYKEFNPASRPVLTLALTSKTLSLGDIYNVADTVLDQRLAQVSGVAQVNLYGGGSPAVRIRLNTQALAAAGLTSTDVYNSVRSANETEPLGVLQGPHRASIITANGQLSTAAQYRRIVLKTKSGALLQLSDVASVVDSVANTQLAASANGQPAITIEITKTAQANVIKTVEGIKKLLPEVEKFLPPSVKLQIMTDRTTTIRASVADIQLTLLITIILVLMVVTLFMRRLTPTIAAGVTVPLSLAGTVAAMWALGFSLDNFSLLALTICVGFVVDDAIVMIENIVAQHERGLTGIEAALVGARQIGFTVISITVSLVVVFLPLTLMGGIIGGLFYEFAMTLSVAIVISGLISLTVTPMICAHFMGRTPKVGRDSRLARGIDRLYNRSLAAYVRSLDWALDHRWLMLASFFLTIVLTIFLYMKIPKAFIPEEDTGLIIAQTLAPSDVSFQRMQRLEARVVKVIDANPAVATTTSRIGVANGFSSANRGTMFIGLKPLDQRNISAQNVIVQLQKKLAHIPGISTNMQVAQDIFFGGQSNGGEYSFSVIDTSLDGLDTVTQQIETKLRTLKDINNISTDQNKAQTEIMIDINRNAAARLGVSIAAIDGVLQNAFAQQQISRIYEAQNQYEVVMKVPADLDRSPSNLSHIFVAGSKGPVPLDQVATYTRTTAPLSVTHLDSEPAGTISFNIAKGSSLGPAVAKVKAAIAELPLPDTVKIQFGGNAKYFLKSLQTEPLLILAAIVAIYIVLGVLYESLSQPLTILSTLPSAGVGALLALLITGTPLSVIGVIGVFLLMGIVKKNGIMLVDFALNAERTGNMGPVDAIRAACVERFRPIMMTTIAAMLGALPLAFAVGTGEQLRRPLGIAVIGGLIVCQALTLYTTPVIYLALSGFGKRRARRITTMPAE